MTTAANHRSLSTWQQAGALLAFVVGCVVVGFVSGRTGDTDSLWYWALDKPFFQPPGWVFGPVWTILYILMGVAAFLVWREGFHRSDVRLALLLFGVQLALNAAWTPVFFAAQSLVGGLIVIVALLAVLVLTFRQFLKISRLAGWLLAPYIAWVSFATLLNLSILLLNL